MFCNSCGAKIEDGNLFCTSCGAKQEVKSAVKADQVEKSAPTAKPASSIEGASNAEMAKQIASNMYKSASDSIKNQINENSYESTFGNMQQSVTDLVLAENEKIVKRYHISHSIRMQCDGYLTATNKRLIFTGNNRFFVKSELDQEIAIDTIKGLDCFMGRNVRLLTCLICLALIALGGVMGFEALDGRFRSDDALLLILAIAVIAVSVLVFIFFGFRKTFKLVVYATTTGASPVNVGEGIRTLAGNRGIRAIVSRPTSETKTMMKEIGALVADLQSMGDMAIEKWSK